MYSSEAYKYGDYGVTVNTRVCGTRNEGSIPSSRPNEVGRLNNLLRRLCEETEKANILYIVKLEGNFKKYVLSWAFDIVS